MCGNSPARSASPRSMAGPVSSACRTSSTCSTQEADKKVVDRVAKARGVPRAQIAPAWVLSKPVVTAPIIGATKLNHLDDAIASVGVILSADEIAAFEEPYVPHPVVGFV